jgi:hypothetical protein
LTLARLRNCFALDSEEFFIALMHTTIFCLETFSGAEHHLLEIGCSKGFLWYIKLIFDVLQIWNIPTHGKPLYREVYSDAQIVERQGKWVIKYRDFKGIHLVNNVFETPHFIPIRAPYWRVTLCPFVWCFLTLCTIFFYEKRKSIFFYPDLIYFHPKVILDDFFHVD